MEDSQIDHYYMMGKDSCALELEQLRAKVAELEAKLEKYENLESVAYMCNEDPERESAFAWTQGICPGCGNYRVPLEK